jgi:L-threonylcarbamoyladenylate synthase
MTLVLRVDPEHPDPESIARAAAVIRAGGLVAFPTETVYGLGANALDPGAVAGIFRAKERPTYDPLIVHLLTADALYEVVSLVPDVAVKLAAHFWPGPLTLVMPRAAHVPPQVTAGGDTVAVRVPSHPVARALLAAAGVPIAAPSANRFGRVSPTCAEHVLADLEGRIDLLLDGGSTQVGVESTVLSLAGPVPTILRPGGVSREALVEVLGEVQVAQDLPIEGESLLSPGTTLKHYAPRAIVLLYRGNREAVMGEMRRAAAQRIAQGDAVGMLLVDEDCPAFGDLPVTLAPLGSAASLEEVAQQLYAALRTLDEAGVSVILVRDLGPEGLGVAIRDRLTRAAAGRVIEVNEGAA